MNPPTIDCTIDNTKLNNKAEKKPSTWKPPTILPHNMIIKALITNKNSPNVKMVTGIDINCNIGFTKKFSNANTITTIIDDPKPLTLMPGKKLASK